LPLTKSGRRRFLDYLAVLEGLVRDAAKAAGNRTCPRPAFESSPPEPFFGRNFVMQSTLAPKLDIEPGAAKLHVGIIMDGNGRWATRRQLSRLHGHQAGVEAIRRVVEAAPHQDVGTLTLYAFSSDNWRRPKAEVTALMALLRSYLATRSKAWSAMASGLT